MVLIVWSCCSVFNAFFQLTGCIVFIILLPTAAPRTQSAHYVFKGWSYDDSGLPNNVYIYLVGLLYTQFTING